MSYYILPKNNNNITINPTVNNDAMLLEPYLSCTLLTYYNELKQQITNTFLNNNDFSFNTYDELIQIINPYEYIFSKVPGSKFSVSKLKLKTNLFYDFLEIVSSLNIFDLFKEININTLYITPNKCDIVECFEMLREGFTDNILKYNNINDKVIDVLNNSKFDFLFFEITDECVNDYILNFIIILLIILKNQSGNGVSIIKISHIFYKPVVDILYILTSLFEKVFVIKPTTSNITTFDKYIVCKNFINDENKQLHNNINFVKLLSFIQCNQENYSICVHSILDYDIPYYFMTKLDDMNITIGQHQLECLNQIINILKNKNKEEKIEIIKKMNVQKAINWCEKYKIPCNKFIDKVNIFLPIVKECAKV